MTDKEVYETLRDILSGMSPPEERVIRTKLFLRKMGKTAHASSIRKVLEGSFSFNFMMAEGTQTEGYETQRAKFVAYSLLILILQRQPDFYLE